MWQMRSLLWINPVNVCIRLSLNQISEAFQRTQSSSSNSVHKSKPNSQSWFCKTEAWLLLSQLHGAEWQRCFYRRNTCLALMETKVLLSPLWFVLVSVQLPVEEDVFHHRYRSYHVSLRSPHSASSHSRSMSDPPLDEVSVWLSVRAATASWNHVTIRVHDPPQVNVLNNGLVVSVLISGTGADTGRQNESLTFWNNASVNQDMSLFSSISSTDQSEEHTSYTRVMLCYVTRTAHTVT